MKDNLGKMKEGKYLITNILQKRNSVQIILKGNNRKYAVDLTQYYEIPKVGEVLDYTYDGHFTDENNKELYVFSLHNERVNLNFYFE